MASTPGVDIVAHGRVDVRWMESAVTRRDTAHDRAIAEIWDRAVAESGDTLHDSPILAFRKIEKGEPVSTVHGEYVPYRYYFARRELDDVGMDVDPIGVNGLTFVAEGARRLLVLGRRSSTVSWYPGCWECVPSGGLDRRCARPDGVVDYGAMLMEEFGEELCIPADGAWLRSSFGFVYDRATRTYDVCCRVEAGCSAGALREAIRRSREYSELMFVPEPDMQEACERLGKELIPTGDAMIRLYGDMR